MDKTAAIVIIGDEILSGKVRDANADLVVRELRDLGVRLRGLFVIPDDVETIAEWTRRLKNRYTYLFSSGGIGPTHDDVTMAGIAKGLSRHLVRSEELVAALATLYARSPTEAVLKMADLPEGAELIWNRPLEVPVIRIDEIHVFPGDPRLFRENFLAVRDRFRCAPFHLVRIFTRCEEVDIAVLMSDAQARFGVSIGSYPAHGNPDYRVQITVESKIADLVRDAARFIPEGIPSEGICRVEGGDGSVSGLGTDPG